MTKFLRILCIWTLAFGNEVTLAQTDSATAENLLRKSGLWEQLGSIAPQIEAGLMGTLSQAGAKPSAAEIDRISRVIKETYSDQRLRAISVLVVSRKLNGKHIPDLQRWYDSPIGHEITKLEEDAAAEGGDPQELMQQATELLGKLPQSRKKLLEELLAETRAAEALTQITINTALAAQQGAASVLPDAPAMSTAELRAGIEAQRPQLLNGFRALALAGFAKVYAPLSTEQLGKYVSFVKSNAGSHFNALCIEALDAALTEAATDLGRKLPSTKDILQNRASKMQWSRAGA